MLTLNERGDHKFWHLVKKYKVEVSNRWIKQIHMGCLHSIATLNIIEDCKEGGKATFIKQFSEEDLLVSYKNVIDCTVL